MVVSETKNRRLRWRTPRGDRFPLIVLRQPGRLSMFWAAARGSFLAAADAAADAANAATAPASVCFCCCGDGAVADGAADCFVTFCCFPSQVILFLSNAVN